MRVIKFRAWNDKKHKMVYWDLLLSPKEWIDKELDCFDIGNIMQYTGLKDKNGKEIYEGDICDAYIAWEDKSYRGFVKFQTCGCGYGYYIDCGSKLFQLEGSIDFEVIGNTQTTKKEGGV